LRRKQGHDPLFSVTYIIFRDAEVEVPQFGKAFKDVDAFLSNLNPNEKKPFSDFRLTADVLGASPLKLDGVFRFRTVPLVWMLDGEIKNFDLVSLKPFVENKTGIIVEGGKVDLFAEAKVEKDGILTGYVKPFLKDLNVKIPKGGFTYQEKNLKEPNALIKMIIKSFEHKTISTKVKFTYNKEWDTDLMEPLKLALEGKLSPGIEDSIQLNP
nr:DUF748 domain-containing protein [Bdellovibrionales bacterium]